MATKVGFACDLGVNSSEIMDFFAAHWPRKIALSDSHFHSWQFESPIGNAGRNSCVVAVNEGRLLGVMGLNKRKFFMSGRLLEGAELTTWIVDKKIKGFGAGAKILSYITSQFDVLFGMGISQDALPIYLRSGFHYLRYIPRFIHVVDAKKVLDISAHASYASKLIKASASYENIQFNERVSWKNEEVIPFIAGNHFVRSLDDLIWRYEMHPYFNYKTFKVWGAGSETGYVVLREEVTKDVKILHIVDIFGTENTYENSIKFAENYAKSNNYWAVDMFSTFAQLNKYFISRSWLSAVDASFINVPHLFHPLEVRNPATTSLIYWAKNPDISFCDISNLYLTKQDCDLDRPTMDFIGGFHE